MIPCSVSASFVQPSGCRNNASEAFVKPSAPKFDYAPPSLISSSCNCEPVTNHGVFSQDGFRLRDGLECVLTVNRNRKIPREIQFPMGGIDDNLSVRSSCLLIGGKVVPILASATSSGIHPVEFLLILLRISLPIVVFSRRTLLCRCCGWRFCGCCCYGGRYQDSIFHFQALRTSPAGDDVCVEKIEVFFRVRSAARSNAARREASSTQLRQQQQREQ